MSEFDFEELDKAVTGAIADKDGDSPSESPESTPAEPQRKAEQPRPAMPAASRGTPGRFMDVVHPSSDMRRPTASAAEKTEPAPAIESTPQPAPPKPAVTLPTPPDFQARNEHPSTDGDSSDDAPLAPLESPFLTGAKVEKRPLGGAPPHSSAEPKEELLLEAPDEPRIEEHALPDPIEFHAQKEDSTPEVKESTDAPAKEADDPKLNEELAGPASINQQYKEQPRGEGGEFTQDAYHQPIAHPAKKRSGWWVILWIFLLVVLGAGAGVAFYLYVLPMI